MATNYLPRNDSDYLTWAQNFSDYVSHHTEQLPITEEDALAVRNSVTSFGGNLLGHSTASDAAHAACQLKDDTRDSSEELIRRVVRQFQASPDVTDDQRKAMGITVRDTMHAMSATAVLNAPLASVDTSKRLTHKIRYWDSQGSGKARPADAVAAEIWLKVTAPGETPPTNPSQFTFLAINSASPFINQFADDDGGKTAHYLIRWIARDGSKGPWSEIISATVAGF